MKKHLGVLRKIDSPSGRINLPSDLMKIAGIDLNSEVEVYVAGNEIILRPAGAEHNLNGIVDYMHAWLYSNTDTLNGNQLESLLHHIVAISSILENNDK